MPDIRNVGGFTPIIKLKKIPLTAATHGTGSAVDTETLPTAGLVIDAWVDVTTAESTGGTKTLDVGLKAGETGGDADGFLDGVSTAATGIVQGSCANAGVTRGALLREDVSGATVYAPKSHKLNGTAKTIVVTSGSAFTEFAGTLYVLYYDHTAV